MRTVEQNCLEEIDFHDSHTTLIKYANGKLVLEFDYIVSETEKAQPNERGLRLILELNKDYFSHNTVSITKQRVYTDKSKKQITCYLLTDFLDYIKTHNVNLQIYDLNPTCSGCIIIAELILDGELLFDNWLEFYFVANKISYEWR